MIQNRHDNERQRLAGLLRTCAGKPEEIASVHRVKEQPMCRLSVAPKSLSLKRPIRQDDFRFGELAKAPEWADDNMLPEYLS